MSESINILEKLFILNAVNEKIRRNIIVSHVFRDYYRKINVILVTNEDLVYCFGANSYGVLGFGHNNSIEELTLNEELSNKHLIDFKSSEYHTIARTSDGKLYCWGINKCLGNGEEDRNISKPQLNKYLQNENIVDFNCGSLHTLVLTLDKVLYGWGNNRSGQIGDTSYWVSKPYKLDEFNEEKLKMISCGPNHSMALTESGHVFSWGDNRCGQLGLNHAENKEYKPKCIQIEVVIQKISCGPVCSLLLSIEGEIYVFGLNSRGQLGLSTNEEKQFTPIKLSHSEKFIDIAANYQYNISAALSINKLYYVWGECGNGLIMIEPKITQFKSFDEIFVILTENNNSFENEYGKYTKYWYEIGKELGEGSYGKVFKVGHKFIGNTFFAMKKIQIFGGNHSYYEFFKELDFLGILKEENEFLVKYHDGWFEQGFQLIDGKRKYANNAIIYIQMDLCDKTLSDIHEEVQKDTNLFSNNLLTKMGYFVLSEMFTEILEGVKYLHTKNIIHRDLHPDNILVKIRQNSNCIKIADFGLAKVHEMNKLHTQDRGHVRYMAPEVERSRSYDTRADIYSLGVILQNLFDINYNNEYESDIMSKYEYLEEICENMTQNNQRKRPECELILKEREKWCIIENELNLKEELFHYLTFSNNKDSYVQKIISSKSFYKYSISSPVKVINNCDKTLQELCDEIKKDSKLYSNNLLTQLGYYIMSEIFIEILEGLMYLHNSNIIHSDLNPSNILVKLQTNGNYIEIAGFDLATVHKINELHTPDVGHIKYTAPDLNPYNILVNLQTNGNCIEIDSMLVPVQEINKLHSQDVGHTKYMAPEVVFGRSYDTRADIYSLGVILQDLFDITFNNKYDGRDFESKFEYLENICGDMTHTNPQKRPKCEQILYGRWKWCINQNEFKLKEELLYYLTLSNKSYVQEVLVSKLLQKYSIGKCSDNLVEMSEIGSSIYGTVFKIKDKLCDDKIFALKKIPLFDEYSIEDSETFINYSKILQLNNEFLVKYYDVWIELNILDVLKRNNEFLVKYHDGWFGKEFQLINRIRKLTYNSTLYIQMDLCDKTLQELSEELKKDSKLYSNNSFTQLDYYLRSEIFIEILQGVKYLHNNNIIHRDLNPSNILVKLQTNGNCIKIAGFDLAILHEINKLHTLCRGHSKYMAPEMQNSTSYDTRADIYSLGVILQELFDFNESSEYRNEFPYISSKYKYLNEVYENMTQNNPRKRPELEQTLDRRDNWCIIENEFNLKEEMFNCLMFPSNNKSYAQKIIESKLLYKYSISSREKYINNWVEISKIGFGSYGEVFKVKDKSDNKIFALKKCRSYVSNFIYDIYDGTIGVLKECINILQRNNEFLAKYHDVWIEYDFKLINGIRELTNKYTLYIQMDLCDKNLRELNEEMKKDSKLYSNNSLTQLGYYLISELFIEIFKGMKYLHNNNIIHANLNLDNILLKLQTNGNSIKIAGFTLATLETTTLATFRIRHLRYMAPDAKNSSSYDIYSLGVILQELFDINFNESSEYRNEFSYISSKYEYLKGVYKNMTQMNPMQRPNCEQILDSIEKWAINESELHFEEELNILLKISYENRSYVQNIIISKLWHIKDNFYLSF